MRETVVWVLVLSGFSSCRWLDEDSGSLRVKW